MSSIRGMLKQARPEDDVLEPAPDPTPTPAPVPASATPLALPALDPVEIRRAMSTRMKPSLQKVLQDYVTEFKAAGYRVTLEMVLEGLAEELRDDADLRARVAGRAITKR